MASLVSNPQKHDKFFQPQGPGLDYGFAEFNDPNHTKTVMQNLNDRVILGNEIRINWVYQNNDPEKEDTSNYCR